jgi:periplasmic protein TonB
MSMLVPHDPRCRGEDWAQLRTWLLALGAALLLNGVCLLVLPWLMVPDNSAPALEQMVPLVQVVRVRTPEPEPSRRQEPPPEPPQPQQQAKAAPKAPVPVAPLQMPFTLETRLPPLATDLQLPAAAVARIEPGQIDGVTMAELDAPISPTTRVPPVYPLHAKRRGTEGWVKVRFVVNEQGEVEGPEVVAAEPAGVFETSVLRCVQRWRYTPGTVEGQAVRTLLETTIHFELQ